MLSRVRQVRLWPLAAGGASALLLVIALVVVLTTRAFAADVADGEHLLPGTTIGGVDVGELTAEEARELAFAEAERRLDHELTVRDGEEAWTLSPRALGGHIDVDAAVEEAVEVNRAAGWATLGRIRWLGKASSTSVELPVQLDEEALSDAIETIAGEVDTSAVDASVHWDGEDYDVVEHVTERTVDTAAAAEDLVEGFDATAPVVTLPVDEAEPDILTTQAEEVLDDVARAADAALDREVTVLDGDEQWVLTPREVGSAPVLDPLLAAAVTGDGVSAETLERAADVEVDRATLGAWLDEVATVTDVAPTNASVDASSGWVDFHDASPGRALEHREALRAVGEALRREPDVVELPVATVEPARTLADYHHVLLLRQGERRLYHYVGGEIVADWPVAVGTNNSPTPTGRFSIGAKRHLPTWHNPAPDGWGEDMPLVVGPGPDNPLGVRALNWVRDGRDTLIRFHGTPNVASIGQAASNGCVRMHNDDVVDLYDRVPHGTTILSVGG